MNLDVATLTIAKAGEALRKKQISAKELTKAVLKEARAKNLEINAYREIFEDAMDGAAHADKLLAVQLRHPIGRLNFFASGNACFKRSQQNRIFLSDAIRFYSFKSISASVHNELSLEVQS